MATDLRAELINALPKGVLGNWSDVAKLLVVTSKFNGHAWLFRGVASEQFELVPKIGRDERKQKRGGVRIPYSSRDEQAVLSIFKLRARAHVYNAPQAELEWMALAQHHGVPTRLLDWTEGMLVALWFAAEDHWDVERIKEGSGRRVRRNGALWCAWDIPNVSVSALQRPFGARTIGVYRPAHFDRRIAAQQSALTLQPSPTKGLKTKDVFKAVVPHDFKFELRKRLDAAGVNKRSLFPDLAGLGEDLAWRYRNNWLAGYREKT